MHRYVKEIPGVKRVVVNDLEEAAVEAARNNMLVCSTLYSTVLLHSD
jgi:tRNA G26 N,N-dimethylase Trm1